MGTVISRVFGGRGNSRASSGTSISNRSGTSASTTPQQPVSSPVDKMTDTTKPGRIDVHVKARIEVYPRSDRKRLRVQDDQVPWDTDFPGYDEKVQANEFNAPGLTSDPRPPWADPPISEMKNTEWNKLDGKINRKSFTGKYKIVNDKPRNPVGRTGLCGRGILGRWGPNHAADPIVTRWKRDENGDIVKNQGKQVAEFIAVKRRDNGEWAIPGGMVDAEEQVSVTLQREFGEEALNSLEASEEEKKEIQEAVKDLFTKSGKEVYKGYVDDPRNTDNSWMETVAINFHDEEGSGVAKFKLNAGDDAVGVQWMELSHELQLYADHVKFLKQTAELLKAYW